MTNFNYLDVDMKGVIETLVEDAPSTPTSAVAGIDKRLGKKKKKDKTDMVQREPSLREALRKMSETKPITETDTFSESFWMSATNKNHDFGAGAPSNKKNLKKLNAMLIDSKGEVTNDVLNFLYTWNPKQGQYKDTTWLFVSNSIVMSRNKIKYAERKNRDGEPFYVEL